MATVAPVLTRSKPDYSFMGTPTATPVATGIAKTPATSTVATRGNLTGEITPTGAYNPYTKGIETVSPTTGVNEGAYSPTNKQNLWQQSGQTGSFQTEAFYRGADGTLQIKPEYVHKVDPTTITNTGDANSYLKGYQADRLTGVDYGAIADSLKSNTPVNYNRVQEYQNMRDSAGVGALESQVTDLTNQENELNAQRRARTQNEQGKAIPIGVMDGRVSEINRQENEKLDAIQRQKSYITDQLKVKNDTIGTLMTLKGQDYDSAVKNYDAEFNKNIQIMGLVRNLNQDQITAADKVADNARASLTTVYNSVTAGGLDPSKLTAQQKVDLQKLEVQAGMPPGIIQTLYDKNPKSDIVFSTKATETDGNDYVQMVVKDRDTGTLKTEKFLLGKSADYQIKQQAAQTAAVKAAKYKSGSGTSSTSKATAAEIKKADALKKSVNDDAATWSTKVKAGDATMDEAHNYLYKKYGQDMTSQGYSDAIVKNIIYNKLK